MAVSIPILAACAASQSESRGTNAPNAAPGDAPEQIVQATLTTQDGTALERAIVIEAETEREGGAQEYRWVAERFPGYKLKKHNLIKQDGRTYDALEITDTSGTEHVIYFDVTGFLGKK